ncbi:sulfotransferase family 2 domain-containing protein [Roseicyclus sp.]|uniref:sulfotransferase family 2 domain-containing protein n=1 Tax=Roseicyclus sp. TaxID=1914329 RepID=UPI003F6A1200
MPLAFVQGKLLHFAHVPRCAGTAVENYLHARFGRLAFLDRQFNALSLTDRWSQTSPQHVETAAFDRIIPRPWIAHRFALVRHPQARILSVFRFQRDIERRVPPRLSFVDWIARTADALAQRPYQYDNHARPAAELVPEDAVVFRLEDGLAPVIDWLDQIEGARRGPREIAPANVLEKVRNHLGRKPLPEPQVCERAQDVIAQIYATDFERFCYQTDLPMPVTPAPAPEDRP